MRNKPRRAGPELAMTRFERLVLALLHAILRRVINGSAIAGEERLLEQVEKELQ